MVTHAMTACSHAPYRLLLCAALLTLSGLARAADTCDWQSVVLPGNRSPMPIGQIGGAWRVACIQVGANTAFAYPFFAARIAPDACGFHFNKTTGSHRRSGQPYRDARGDRSLVLLGALTVNDAAPRAYAQGLPTGSAAVDEDHPANHAGRLFRLGLRERLLILDANAAGYELYGLRC